MMFLIFYLLPLVSFSSPQIDGKSFAETLNAKADDVKNNGLKNVDIPKSENPDEVHLNDEGTLNQKKEERAQRDDHFKLLESANQKLGVLEPVTFDNPNINGQPTVRTVTKTVVRECIESGDPYEVRFKKELKIDLKLIPIEYFTEAYCQNHGWQRVDSPYRRGCYLNGHTREQVMNMKDTPKREQVLRPRSVVIRSEQWIGDDADDFIKAGSNNDFDVDVDYTEGASQTRSLETISDRDAKGNVVRDSEPITRDCWEKEYFYKIYPKPCFGCDDLKDAKCRQIKADCLHSLTFKNGTTICIKWKKTFECDEVQTVTDDIDLASFNQTEIPTSTANKNMYNALSKLEALKDIEQQQEQDGTKVISIFKGNEKKCTNKFGGAFRNCCNKDKGWGTKIGLASDCTADEKMLRKMKSESRCFHVGTKKEKSLCGLLTTTKEAYCCFDTVLAKNFQIGARKQLGIGWGNFHSPNCRGLTPQELEKADMSTIDLSESFKGVQESAKMMAKNLEISLKQKQELLKKSGKLSVIKQELKPVINDQFLKNEALTPVIDRETQNAITARDIREQNKLERIKSDERAD